MAIYAKSVARRTGLRRLRPTQLPLENGDHLDQKTFHAQCEAMPPETRAELIGGIVYMGSPLKGERGWRALDLG
jgi:hypothetical protein